MAVLCQACAAELETWTGKCPHCGGVAPVELKTPHDPMVGRIISGRYRVHRRLGQGGMGSVYLAEHTGVGQQVAVKFLNPVFSDDPEVVRRFLNEARSYGQISHPHAVQLHDFGQDEDGTLFISMEYIQGVDLKRTLERERRLPLKDALDVALQVCDVLGHAHSKGIVHRDLKPENIMLVQSLRGYFAKVLDFGVARLMAEQGTRLTAAGSICGTPRYMSPEQAEGGEVDHRSDIYALGLVLFEAVTGVHPFEAPSVAETLRMQVSKPMPRAADLAPELALPEGFDAAIQKAVAKQPQDRFGSMSAFAQQLVPLFEQAEAVARQAERSDRTMVRRPLEKTAHQASPYERERKERRVNKKLIAAVAGALAAAAALVAVAVSRPAAPSVWEDLDQAEAAQQRAEAQAAMRAQAEAEAAEPVVEAPPEPGAEAEEAEAAQPVARKGARRTAAKASDIQSVRLLAEGGMHNQALNEFTAGRLAAASEMLERIPADSPLRSKADELKSQIQELTALIRRGDALQREGRCAEAVPVYEQVIRRNPRIPGVAENLRKCRQGLRPEILE